MAYSTRAQIEARFGTSNVATWGDLNNNQNEVEITARIAEAIAAADAQIEDTLRPGPYTVPFAAETPPRAIREISVALAAVWLYESRGTNDVDGKGRPLHKLIAAKNEAELKLCRILDGLLLLDLDTVGSQIPAVVPDEGGDEVSIPEPGWE